MRGSRIIQKAMMRVIILIIYLIYYQPSFSQTADLYLDANTNLYFFDRDTASIFGNVLVNGTLAQQSGSYLYFFGKKWINTPSASLSDGTVTGIFSMGGTVHFQQPSLLYGDLGEQSITGSYDALNLKGPAFGSLVLNNAAGLQLEEGASLAVKQQLRLNKGKIYLNGSDLVIGTPFSRGFITGYDDQRYIVTGTETMGGFLNFLNVNKGTDSLIFPIGANDQSYTPLALQNLGPTDHFKARVFNGVFTQGLSGNDISYRSVNKTWLLAAANHPLQANLTLQHNIAEESSLFFNNRQTSYISRNINGVWDTGASYAAPQNPGTLTSGSPVTTAAMNSRLFTNGEANSLYILAKLTKDTIRYDYPQELADFTATRLSPVSAKLNWHTRFAGSISVFEIQKRKTNELDWITIATVPATSSNSYSWPDADVYYPDPVYYRLNIVYRLGTHKFSEIRSIPGVNDHFALAYPNPAHDLFTITVSDYTQVKTIILYNEAGQKLQEKNMTTASLQFDIGRYASGVYFAVIIAKDKGLLATLKVIKQR